MAFLAWAWETRGLLRRSRPGIEIAGASLCLPCPRQAVGLAPGALDSYSYSGILGVMGMKEHHGTATGSARVIFTLPKSLAVELEE